MPQIMPSNGGMPFRQSARIMNNTYKMSHKYSQPARISQKNFKVSTLSSGPLSTYDIQMRTYITEPKSFVRKEGKVLHPFPNRAKHQVMLK